MTAPHGPGPGSTSYALTLIITSQTSLLLVNYHRSSLKDHSSESNRNQWVRVQDSYTRSSLLWINSPLEQLGIDTAL